MRIAVVNLSEVKVHKTWRLEAEFHTQPSLIGTDFVTGKDIISFVQYGTSKELNENGYGYPVLRLNEFDSLFIKSPGKYCNKIDSKTYESLSLKKGDVLICRTNGNPKLVGKAAFVPKNYDFAFASYLFRVRPKSQIINPATLMIYLNSKVGRTQIEKNLMISNQANFSPAKFRETQIPVLGSRVQSLIEKIVYTAFDKLQLANSIYLKTEDLLLQEIGLKGWELKHKLSFIKSFSDTQVTGRIDAEYFQPMYDEIEEIIKKRRKGFDLLRNRFSLNKKTFKKIPGKEYQYIEISCVNVSNGSMVPLRLNGSDLPANAKIKLFKDDIIVSKVRPYRGAIGIVDSNDFVGSGAFTVLQENGEINKETLMVFLRTKAMLNYALKFNTGASYPTITDDDILDYPVPMIKQEKQKQIKSKIEEVIKARQTSRRLLSIAKRGVETAIEKSEKEAENWMKKEAEKCQIHI